MTHTRRRFITQSAMAAAGISAARLGRAVQPNDKINVGVIGCNGMGFADLTSLLKIDEVDCRALCDVDANVLRERAAEVEAATSIRPKLYADYRQLLEDRDIDAVVIGTPDHWHCLIMVDACEVGKDVYVEKPMANSTASCKSVNGRGAGPTGPRRWSSCTLGSSAVSAPCARGRT
jgi:hypothetical protein